MSNPPTELGLDDLPFPPLFKLADDAGEDVFEEREVGGEPARVGALFATWELAEAFSREAEEHGMGTLAGLSARELSGWEEVEVYAVSGEDYVLVVSGDSAGLFHASDVAQKAAERAGGMPFPLYILSDEKGEAPLISVEEREGEIQVVALFSSPEKARAFREHAPHLELPDRLGTIEDQDGLRRHALVAREAGADYAVVDPESGSTDAIPVEELTR